jgi:hypothetical protein
MEIIISIDFLTGRARVYIADGQHIKTELSKSERWFRKIFNTSLITYNKYIQ